MWTIWKVHYWRMFPSFFKEKIASLFEQLSFIASWRYIIPGVPHSKIFFFSFFFLVNLSDSHLFVALPISLPLCFDLGISCIEVSPPLGVNHIHSVWHMYMICIKKSLCTLRMFILLFWPIHVQSMGVFVSLALWFCAMSLKLSYLCTKNRLCH